MLPPNERAQLRQAAIDARCIQSLAHFIGKHRAGKGLHDDGEARCAWEVVEPGVPLSWNWHLDIICDELEAVITRRPMLHPDGEMRPVSELVICIPPGMMKSLLVSVFFPTWCWLRWPHKRFLCIANSDKLVARDSRRAREVIETAWYQRLMRIAAKAISKEPWHFAKDQNQVINYGTRPHMGERSCFPIGGRVTGQRGDIMLIDDPSDAAEVLLGSVDQVAKRMEEVRTIYDGKLESRRNDRTNGPRILIMQRLHQDDLAAHLIERGARCVVLPTEFDPEFPPELGGVHPDDPRTEPGELLFPERDPPEEVAKRKLNASVFAAQDQQRPTAAEGTKFRASWMQYYNRAPDEQVRHVDVVRMSVDCAAKKGKGRSYTSIQVWGQKGEEHFLLDLVQERMEYPEMEAAVKLRERKWKRLAGAKLRQKYMEDASNGVTFLQRNKGWIPVSPTKHGGKEARAGSSQAHYEALCVWLPLPKYAPKVQAFIDEHLAFPLGASDDMVDAESQYFIKVDEGEQVADPLEVAKRQLRVLSGR